MPQLGETVTEGTVTKWLKAVGEAVERDEPLFEVSTDKVDSEVPSPAAGVLQQIVVPEGETVDVGTVLAVVSDGGAPAGEAPAPARARCVTSAAASSVSATAAPVTAAPVTAAGHRRRAPAGCGEPGTGTFGRPCSPDAGPGSRSAGVAGTSGRLGRDGRTRRSDPVAGRPEAAGRERHRAGRGAGHRPR